MQPWPDIRGIVSDLDGVVYRGNTPIRDAVEAVHRWHARGIRFTFVTNNSTKTAAEFAAKLQSFGVPATAEDVVTTAFTTGEVMKARWPAATRVFVIGAESLSGAIEAAGFTIADRDAEVVVVGLDREVTYAKLKSALRCMLGGATLIGTNPDRMLPTSDGFEPGAGALLACVAAAAGITSPPLVIGKPEPHMIEAAVARLGTPKAATIMVGDQVGTDIKAGKRAGLVSVLVRTGVPGTEAEAPAPDHVVDSLLDIPIGAEG